MTSNQLVTSSKLSPLDRRFTLAEFQTINLPWQSIHSDLNTGNGDFNVCTGWLAASDVSIVQIWFEVQNTTDATGVIKPAYQTADVENGVDTPTAITSVNTQTGAGQSFPANVFDISAVTNTKQLVRFGFFFLASSADIKMARVQARIKIKKS